ncbi:hypothetical protein QR680_009233 [Steinernema hermaphroditum]|uniref:RRM domain-containing protein n=1 Tax=Steinernema hermaphroditum TaxID=289476 RepID=A0AA39ILB1_9BILA|nr:hypothetical protein QR680_009233 [Steinernema hermaphroditum]
MATTSNPLVGLLGRLNHVAMATRDIEKATQFYRNLGARVSEPVPQEEHGVYTVFIELPNSKIELLGEYGPRSPIKAFLDKNKNGGIHHICIEVRNIDEAIKTVKDLKIRALSETSKIGAHGKPMAAVDGWRGDPEFDRNERKRTVSRERDRSRSPLRDRRRRTPPRHERRAIDARNDRMVYLSNIPYDVRWMEIKDLVREKAGEVVFVEVLEDRDGRPKGSAVVEFKNKESVERCVEALHRFEMKGRQVVAKEIRDPVAFFRKVREDTGVDFLSGRGGDAGYGFGRDRGGAPGEIGETYGLSPVFLKQLHIEGPLNNRVFVANLGYNVSCGKLFDVFKLAGKVTWLDLQMDKDGKSKGLAVVQYSHPIEAVQAISMLNGQRLYDRPMTVKMDRFEKEPELREGELPVGLRALGMGLGANGAPLADVASVVSSVATANSNTPLTRVAPEPYYSPQEPAYQSTPSGAVYQASIANQNSNYASGGTPAAGGYVAQFSKPANPPSQPSYGAGATGQPAVNAGAYTAGGPAAGPSGYNASSGGGSSYGGYNTYSGSADSYSVTRTLLIKNLPPDYSWHIVRDRVQQFGAVESCEIVAKGCAKVKYYNVAEAERAKVTLQGSTVEGRTIGIEYL